MFRGKTERLLGVGALASVSVAAVLLIRGGPRAPDDPSTTNPPELSCTLLPAQSGWVQSLAFSADGRLLAVGLSEGHVRGCCLLWDLAVGRECRRLSDHGRAVSAACFSPDGRRLATGSSEGTVKVWEPASGTAQGAYSAGRQRVLQLCFSPDGTYLAGGSFYGMNLWNLRAGRETASLPGRVPLSFAPDGQTLASARQGRAPGVQVWDVARGETRSHPPDPFALPATLDVADIRDTPVDLLAYAPDWKTLAAGLAGHRVLLWDPKQRRPRVVLSGHEQTVTAVVFGPDGGTVATASNDQTVKLWDVATGQLRATLAGHAGAVYAVAFAPDGRRLASGGCDKVVRVWDIGPDFEPGE